MSGLLTVVPLLGAGASLAVMLSFRGSGLALVGAAMMLLTILASVLMNAGQRGRAARSRRAQRAAYLSYLERTRRALVDAEAARAEVLGRAHPSCRALPSLVRNGGRLWERRPGDADFLRVRLGRGTVRLLHLEHRGEHDPLRAPDDFLQAEMERVQRRFERSPGTPVAVALPAPGVVSVVGERAFREHVARLLLTQVACFASPDDLHLALVVPPRHRSSWGWATWLPHLSGVRSVSCTGSRPRVAPSVTALHELLRQDRGHDDGVRTVHGPPPARSEHHDHVPMLLVMCDGKPDHDRTLPGPVPAVDGSRTAVVHLLSHVDDEPSQVDLRVHQLDLSGRDAWVERSERRGVAPVGEQVRLDEWGRAECAALARTLAGLRPAAEERDYPRKPLDRSMVDLLGVGSTGTVDLARQWTERPSRAFLRVPIGFDDAGDVVELDLKEAAESGMGPHGLCVGATGSGKSELLRTLVLSLLSTHSPEDLAMVLVDYKGGATFAPFAPAPHVHGVITNLGHDTALVERVYASLAGEVRRRQELLRAAGHLPDITAYRRHRRGVTSARRRLAPMPHLLVIVDEFGELLSARPEFVELFLSIGRIGRSIGVHLLLSSQRIEAGRLRGLETHLSYRIGLRTLSAAESRTVLDTGDAFSLPTKPGYGYLKVDSSVYRRFRAGFVSGPLQEHGSEQAAHAPLVQLAPFYGTGRTPGGAARAERDPSGVPDPTSPGPERSLVQTVVTALADQDRVGPPVWLPPLPEQLTLDEIPTASGGGPGPSRGPGSSLTVPLGLLDDPARQWQGRWELDLTAAGNVLLVGGPRTGRSTVLRSLAASLALHHPPDSVVVYGVDATGSGLRPVDALPIVAGVGCRRTPELMRRVLADVHTLLTTREQDSERARDRADRGSLGATSAGVALPARTGAHAVVLIDGLGTVCEEHPEVVETVHALLRRGPTHGIHLVCTGSRRHEVRMQVQSCFTTVLELRLSDPAESGIGRAQAHALVSAPAGRCLLPSGHFAQAALPRVDGQADRETAEVGLSALVRRVQATATLRAPRVRVLPATVTPDEVAGDRRPGAVGLGVDDVDFGTAVLDLDGADRHVLMVGAPGTGKTSVLAHVLSVLVEQHPAEDLVIAQIDPRRALQAHVPPDYLGGYAGSATRAQRLVEAVVPELDRRSSSLGGQSAPNPTPCPRIVVAVDDYEAVTAGGACPLGPLVRYLPIAPEIGLTLLLTRSAHGAARGVFEPVVAAVRDSGATGLLFSGDPAEGPLFGAVRPQWLPPGRALLVRPGRPVRTVQTAYLRPGTSSRATASRTRSSTTA